MFRLALFATALAGCSCGSKSSDTASAAPPPSGPDKIVERAPAQPMDSSKLPADDPSLHLKPDEGTLTYDSCEGKAGSEVVGTVKVKPGSGFHLNTGFPTKLMVKPPDGVKVAKSPLVNDHRNKAKGDADELTEQLFVFSVHATADKPGNFEIPGMFKFGVCDESSCRPKLQPIAIKCAAK
jgi:hypothetical protein